MPAKNKLSPVKSTTSARLQLYYHVRELVRGLDGVNYWGVWNSQLQELGQHDFSTPAVFFEFSSFDNNLTRKNNEPFLPNQIDDVEFTLHVVFESYKRNEEMFINHMELVNEVYRRVFFTKLLNTHPIVRIRELQDISHIQIADFQITFKTVVEECGEDLINGDNIRDGEQLVLVEDVEIEIDIDVSDPYLKP